MSGGDVLEQNLERLFRASWRPVVPSARFEAALRARLEAEVVARVAASSARRTADPKRRSVSVAPRSHAARTLRLAAAILALVAAIAAAWTLARGRSSATSAGALVDAGQVAIADDPGAVDAWRAATDDELARGVEIGTRSARVATPPERAITVHLGSAGRVDVTRRTEVSIGPATDDGARDIALDGESARVRRDGGGEPWRLATPDGVVALARGILTWSRATGGPDGATSFVELAAGIAWIASEPRAELSIGQRAWIREGRIVLVTALAEPVAPIARRPTDASSTTDAAPDAPVRAPDLVGSIALPAGAPDPASFRVTLLRRVQLPDIAQPEATEFRGTRAFELDRLRAGTYDVFVEAPGFAVAMRGGVAVTGTATVDVRFDLAPSRAISGLVRDASTGAPIAGATVLAEALIPSQVVPFEVDVEAAGWRAATRTRADGSFTLEGLGADAVDLRVSARGHAARWVAGVVPAESGSGQEELAPIELVPGGSIEGRVLRRDGTPWPGAIVIASRIGISAPTVRMSYGSTRSAGDGSYALVDLPAGQYVVFSVDPSAPATPATRDVRIAGAEVVHLDLGPTDRRTRVVGTIRDARGEPQAELDVMLDHEVEGAPRDSNWIAARTDSAGRFTFEGVEPLQYELFVGRGLGTSFVRVGEVDVPLAPEVRQDVVLPSGSIEGRVLAVDGSRAAGAWLILYARIGSGPERFVGRTQADSAGEFALFGVAPGAYAITAHAEQKGVAAVRVADVDVAGAKREVELRFVPGVELAVRVLGADGRPIAGRAVRFVDTNGVDWQFDAQAATNARGEVVVPGIAPGRWRIAVEGAPERVLDLEIGPRREVVVEVDPGLERPRTEERR